MFSGFSIGQYVPINSSIHRLDPRLKLFAMALLVFLVVLFSSIEAYLFFTAYIHVLLYLSGLEYSYILRGLKPIIFLVTVTIVFNALFTPGVPLWWRLSWEGVYFAVLFSLRIYLLVMVSILLSYTTSPLRLTDAIEYFFKPLKVFKIPVEDLALTLTIAFRFIPTLADELDKLIKAQMSRGVNFSQGSLFTRIKKLLPVFIPLFVSCFKRAEELADAMESRGYRGGEFRTRREALRFSQHDLIAFLVMIVSSVAGMYIYVRTIHV